MTCDRYFELLSARLDGTLTPEEERALEEHQAGCPACRAAGAQLAALQAGFGELEDIPAPEGFTQGVMGRIRKEKTVVPLFKRPQVRALAGLAACAVLVVGLYSAARFPQKETGKADSGLITRSYGRDMGAGELEDSAALEDDPQIAAYAAPEPMDGIAPDVQKTVPDAALYSDDEPQHYTFQNDQYLRLYWTSFSQPPEPAARIVGSTQSLAELLELFHDDFSWLQAQYDAAYFETGQLLAVVMVESSGSIGHQIPPDGLLRDQVTVRQLHDPDANMTCDTACWLILAEVDRAFDDGDELALNIISWADGI